MVDVDEPIRTWRPAELHAALNDVIEHVFGSVVWVEGEVSDLTRSRAGHVYFRLVDADGDRADNRPALAVTLFDSRRREVYRFLSSQGEPLRMSDGIRIRVGGRLATYAARSTIQLVMDRIDPAFTLGLLGQERARLLAALEAEGLLERNAALPMPLVPLRIAVITSVGSAAHADVLDEIGRSGIGFHVSVLDARTQGVDAPDSVVAALRTAAALDVDLALLVRGGGATTDLAAFDDEAIARAIAHCPVPVITGIGHETDTTVADIVTHTAHKTPTAAAAAVVDAVRRAERRIVEDWAAVRSGVGGRLVRADDRLVRVGHRVGSVAKHQLERRRDAVDRLGHQLTSLSRLALRSTSERVALLDARAAVHDPAAALRRGWTITRAADGRMLRSVHDADVGDELVTTTADGRIRSRVIDIDDQDDRDDRDEGGTHRDR